MIKIFTHVDVLLPRYHHFISVLPSFTPNELPHLVFPPGLVPGIFLPFFHPASKNVNNGKVNHGNKISPRFAGNLRQITEKYPACSSLNCQSIKRRK